MAALMIEADVRTTKAPPSLSEFSSLFVPKVVRQLAAARKCTSVASSRIWSASLPDLSDQFAAFCVGG